MFVGDDSVKDSLCVVAVAAVTGDNVAAAVVGVVVVGIVKADDVAAANEVDDASLYAMNRVVVVVTVVVLNDVERSVDDPPL
jgi:hypothetical protein